jgi:hypothetical protein
MPKSHLSSFSWMIAHSKSHAPQPTALLWHKTAGNPLKRPQHTARGGWIAHAQRGLIG